MVRKPMLAEAQGSWSAFAIKHEILDLGGANSIHCAAPTLRGDSTIAFLSRHLDWDSVRVFLAIARAGGMRGAADTLRVNHATIARRLRGLETDLATRLFDRSRAGLTLTQAGEELIGPAERMELEAHAIRRRVAGRDARPSGPVRVSVPPILAFKFLAEPFADFARAHPEIDLRVAITDRFSDLRSGETDVSIRVAYEVDDDALGRRVIRYTKAVYASPRYLAERPDLSAGGGAEAEWIGWSDEGRRPTWVRASPFPHAAVRHVLPDVVLQLEAAAAGMGLTYLPCFVGDADSRLRRVPSGAPVDDRSIWLLLHSDLQRTARVRALVDFMAEAILARRAMIRGHRPQGRSSARP